MASFHMIYPQLDGVKINEDRTLPFAVIQAIRKAYDYIAQVSAAGDQITVIVNLHVNRATLYPAASYAVGSFYAETDRNEALYVVREINGANFWVLVHAQMFGTLVPDQRPTDLGVFDGGFIFRTSVPPPREFIWSQTAWVEVTPQPQTPWASDIDGSAHKLTNVAAIAIGVTSSTYPFDTSSPMRIRWNGSTGAGFWLDGNSLATVAFVGMQPASNSVLRIFSSALATDVLTLDLSTGRLGIPGLPSVNPGAGSKQLWYDPADSNRVKFAP